MVGLALQLRIRSRSPDGEAAPALEICIEELLAALKELWEFARGIRPAVLTDHGLRAALDALVPLARRCRWTSPRACRRGWRPRRRGAVYFVVSEALENTAKYGRTTSVLLNARVADGRAEVTVSDDGVGGAFDGHITLDSPPGPGTTVREPGSIERSKAVCARVRQLGA